MLINQCEYDFCTNDTMDLGTVDKNISELGAVCTKLTVNMTTQIV
jgi:hypothetical protein